MAGELKAEDVLPLIAKLSRKERQRLFRLALGRGRTDAQTYAAQLPKDDEFTSDDDRLSWEGEGWEKLSES